jgi:hypothetical protein
MKNIAIIGVGQSATETRFLSLLVERIERSGGLNGGQVIVIIDERPTPPIAEPPKLEASLLEILKSPKQEFPSTIRGGSYTAGLEATGILKKHRPHSKILPKKQFKTRTSHL